MQNPADAMPLARLFGVEVPQFDREKVTGTMTVREDLCTAGNHVHGGALMAFADSLAAIGAYLNLPEKNTGTTTVESKTNFLGKAESGTVLTGTATPMSIGRRLTVWQTRIEDQEQRPIAVVMQTQMFL